LKQENKLESAAEDVERVGCNQNVLIPCPTFTNQTPSRYSLQFIFSLFPFLSFFCGRFRMSSGRELSKHEKEKQNFVQEKCQALRKEMLRDDDNKYCVDCDDSTVTEFWQVSTNIVLNSSVILRLIFHKFFGFLPYTLALRSPHNHF